MKKRLLFIFPLLSVLINPLKVNYLNAAVESEKASYQDMVVRTAMNNGGLYTDATLVDYNIIHGSVKDNNLVNFTESQCVVGSNWTASLGSSTDNAYCNHWRLDSFNNDGIIAQVVAKQNVFVDVSRAALGGWPDNAQIGVYKLSGTTLSTISEFIATSSTPLTSYNFSDIALNKGEKLFYEFKTPSTVDNYRNLQQLPNFTFKLNSDGGSTEVPDTPIQIPTTDYSNESSIDLAKLSKEVVALKGEDVTLKDMKLNLLQGNIGGNIQGFSNYSINNDIVLISDTDSFEGTVSPAFNNYRIKTTEKDSALFKIEATSDIKLTITHPSCNEGWIDEHGQYFALHTLVDGKYYTQWEKPILSNIVAENQFGGEVMLKQGDVAYFEFGSNIANERNVNIAPVFTASTLEYDETIRNSQCKILSASLKDVVMEAVANNGGVYKATDMEIELLQGNVFTGTKTFKNYLSNNTGGLLSDSETFDGQDSAAFETWRMKTTNTSSAIIKVNAINDIKLDITHSAIDGGWIDEFGQYIGLYYKHNDSIYTIWNKPIVSSQLPENTYAGSVMLKQGDIAYYVFGSTQALERNVNLVPSFTSNIEDFNEEVRLSQCKIADEKIAMWDALTAVLNNDFNDVSYNLVNYGFYIGKVKEEEKCEVAVGDGSGTPDDALWNGDLTAGFLRWQIQCDVNKDAIMKITAKENVNITISHTAIWEDAWSTFTSVRYYVMDLDGSLANYKEIPVDINTKADYFAIDVNLLKNQVLYIDYYTRDDQYGSLNFAPVITVSNEKFDESKVIDFDFVRALNVVKENNIYELEDMLYEINEFDYSYSNYEKIKKIFSEAITAIQMANSEEEINSIVERVPSLVDEVITYADLNSYKNAALDEFEKYISSINSKDYSKDNYQLIENKIKEAKEAIKKAPTMTEIDNIIKNTKVYIENIDKKKSGCTGSSSSIAGLLLSALAIRLLKNIKR